MNCCNNQSALTLEEQNNQIPQKKTNNSSNNNNSEPLYSKKNRLMCMFCGGKECNHENYLTHKGQVAIEGLNSDQIDENIFASQRPSNILIDKFDLITKFNEKKIGLIINVQRAGEHPYCGPNEGLDKESGFTYSPSKFESKGIKVKLCGWQDMGVPESLDFMLDIVKEMYHYINFENKKVLVHCHAGYGRTGIVIACYKIFSEHTTAENAIKEIRAKRKQCIQKSTQFEYCVNFYKYISRLREMFGNKKTIETYIKNQNDLNVDNYKFDFFSYKKYVPLFIQYIFNAILVLKNSNELDLTTIYKTLNGTSDIIKNLNNYLNPIIESINAGNFNILNTIEDIVILSELLYLWLEKSIDYVIEDKNLDNFDFSKKDESDFNKIFEDNFNKLKIYEKETILFFINFIYLLKTNKDLDDPKNIKLMCEKFCIYLLGYDINNIDQDLNKKRHIETLLDIFYYYLNNNEKINDIYNVSNKELRLNNILNICQSVLDQNNNDSVNANSNKNKNDLLKQSMLNILNELRQMDDINVNNSAEEIKKNEYLYESIVSKQSMNSSPKRNQDKNSVKKKVMFNNLNYSQIAINNEDENEKNSKPKLSSSLISSKNLNTSKFKLSSYNVLKQNTVHNKNTEAYRFVTKNDITGLDVIDTEDNIHNFFTAKQPWFKEEDC